MMVRYAERHLNPLALSLAAAGIDDDTGEVPKFVVEQLEWAYLQGMRFVDQLHEVAGGWKLVDYAIRSRPPVSTEQILHVAKYLRDERPLPVAIDGADLRRRGWHRAGGGVLGEYGTRQILALGLEHRDAAARGGGLGRRPLRRLEPRQRAGRLRRRGVPRQRRAGRPLAHRRRPTPARRSRSRPRWAATSTRGARRAAQGPDSTRSACGVAAAGRRSRPAAATWRWSFAPRASASPRTSRPRTAAADRMPAMTRLQKACAGFWIFAGIMHFVRPRAYEAIMPPQLPMHREAVAVSGVAEIVGGLAITQPSTRRFARWWLLALLAAVFPANIYMALEARRRSPSAASRPTGSRSWALYGRLPLQFYSPPGSGERRRNRRRPVSAATAAAGARLAHAAAR